MNSGEYVTLRDFFERLFREHHEQHAREHSADLVADRQHEHRHEQMNEIREQLREQQARFVSLDTFVGHETRSGERLSALERTGARYAGGWAAISVVFSLLAGLSSGLIVAVLR